MRLINKMRTVAIGCVVVAALVAGCLGEQTSFENYKVYQILPKSMKDVNILKGFENSEDVDFWSEMRQLNKSVDIMVSPQFQAEFTNTMKMNHIDYFELIPDVDKVFQSERLRQVLTPRAQLGRINFKQFHGYSVIQEYLRTLSKEYDFVNLEVIAQTSEGRDLYMVKIDTSKGGKKPTILVDGGIHAREWIAPATVLYIINQLVENPENQDMIDSATWLIIPVLNPDGYEYSRSNNRLWRKTRSVGNQCFGVDGNRNFPYHWMEIGASNHECSDTYAGKHALSEPETYAIKNIIEQYKGHIKLYLTFHSHGQYLLYPWGFTSSLPSDWKELHGLAEKVERAISGVAGTRYTIGSSTNVLYAAAGGSDDYVKAIGGVELSYTIELPGGGKWGFDLPASRIDPVVKETFEGVKVYHSYIVQKFGKQ